MTNDEEGYENINTPTPQEWAKMMEDPKFAEFVRSMPPPPWIDELDEDKE